MMCSIKCNFILSSNIEIEMPCEYIFDQFIFCNPRRDDGWNRKELKSSFRSHVLGDRCRFHKRKSSAKFQMPHRWWSPPTAAVSVHQLRLRLRWSEGKKRWREIFFVSFFFEDRCEKKKNEVKSKNGPRNITRIQQKKKSIHHHHHHHHHWEWDLEGKGWKLKENGGNWIEEKRKTKKAEKIGAKMEREIAKLLQHFIEIWKWMSLHLLFDDSNWMLIIDSIDDFELFRFLRLIWWKVLRFFDGFDWTIFSLNLLQKSAILDDDVFAFHILNSFDLSFSLTRPLKKHSSFSFFSHILFSSLSFWS